jgi:C-terminal processing protease CtpA/Prc
MQRKGMWGEKTYREAGSTAIIRLDSFMPDEAAWTSYYSGEGDFPDDSLGIVISGLRKAAENPKIKNIIFDLTCNGGGSPDVMMAILAVTTGQTQLYGKQKITGQNMTITFEADTNFDGVYDEKDKEVHYDFNYGVLTTRYAFSCGNLFPIIAQEGGAVLIGEPTSGGSCCVQVGSDAQGLSYMMSSAQWQLTDSAYNSVEGGCSIDLPIETKSSHFVDKIVSIAGVDEGVPSFLKFFNAKRLNRMMNEWFENQSQTDLAA